MHHLIQQSYEKATKDLRTTTDKLKTLEEKSEEAEYSSSDSENSTNSSSSNDNNPEPSDYAELSKRDLISTIQERDKHIEDLIQEQETSFDIIEKKNAHIVNLKQQLKTTMQDSKDHLDKIIELTGEKRKLKKQLESQNQRPNTTNTVPQNNEPPVEMHVLMDSNRKFVKPHLKDSNEIKYKFNTTTYTTDDLAEKLEDLCNNHKPNNQYTIMLGTNNLKMIPTANNQEMKKEITKETYDNIKASAIKLRQRTEACVHIIQIPPHQTNNEINNEIISVNQSLSKLPNRDAGINYITPFAPEAYEEDLDRSEVIDEDGIHLTAYGGKLVADCMKDNEKNVKQYLTSTMVTADKTRLIIGKDGTRINHLRNKYNVLIATVNNQGTTKITLRGAKKNMEDAKDEIKSYLMRAENTTQQKEEGNNHAPQADTKGAGLITETPAVTAMAALTTRDGVETTTTDQIDTITITTDIEANKLYHKKQNT